MELRAKVALSLPNKFYTITLKYDTFEKATYDAYLIASLVANAPNEEEAMQYIDDITGNGSLNPHFRNLYDEISKMTKEQINGILEDSLYPITVVDKSHHFKYYEMFNVSRMNNKVFSGNLENNPKLAEMIMPKEKGTKFLSIEFEGKEGNIQKDNYNAIFYDNAIGVDLGDGQYYSISKDNFLEVFDNDNNLQSNFMPKIGKIASPGNWNVLTKAVVDTWGKNKLTYKDNEGNLAVLQQDCIKVTEVITAFDLFFYKETRYDFIANNRERCENALDFLMASKNINEFKNKSLASLIYASGEKKAQAVVQFFLDRKDSKEIAEIGLKLIKSGLEKGWDKNILIAIKKFTPQNDYPYLYRINSNLNFSVTDLLNIDNIDLTEADLIKKKAYLAEKENLINAIKMMMGDITTSGVREKIKRLQKDNVVTIVKKFLNENQGHNEGKYASMSLEDLKKEYEKLKTMYNGNFAKIRERCDKLDN